MGKASSMAITDNIFLKLVLDDSIYTKELQTEGKKFTKNGLDAWETILEKILVNYRYQVSSEHINFGESLLSKVYLHHSNPSNTMAPDISNISIVSLALAKLLPTLKTLPPTNTIYILIGGMRPCVFLKRTIHIIST